MLQKIQMYPLDFEEFLYANGMNEFVVSTLRNKFNHKYNIIESITLNNGDTHNNGKSVMIFNFDNNEKVVYKPHGLHGDEALNKIYEYINSKNISEVEFFNVDVINKEYYGWQKFI